MCMERTKIMHNYHIIYMNSTEIKRVISWIQSEKKHCVGFSFCFLFLCARCQVPMWSTYGQLSREVRGCCIQVGQPSWVWWVYMERKAHFNRASLNFIHKALVTLFSWIESDCYFLIPKMCSSFCFIFFATETPSWHYLWPASIGIVIKIIYCWG